MPAWESVNAVKTPTTYSWISRVRLASNAQIRSAAAALPAGTTIRTTYVNSKTAAHLTEVARLVR